MEIASSILIVDDNVQYTKVLTKILQAGFGYNDITSSESVEAALELVAQDPDRFQLIGETRPQIVSSNLHNPSRTGVDGTWPGNRSFSTRMSAFECRTSPDRASP